MIFISSEFSEMVGVCNRVLVLQEGRLVGELDGDAVTERNIIELCYGHVGRGRGVNGAPTLRR